MVHEVEDFYGVYLLYCLNPKFKGRTYIGYTVNPNRRIKQHNTGAHAGGAYRTSGRGPWEMALIIHGFPNDVSGLRFEWAWQHPDKSRRLRGIAGKSRKETAFQYRWRVACCMLRTAPWSGLCLRIRWLKQDFKLDFPVGLEPPVHMPVVFGPVVSKKVSKSTKKSASQSKEASSESDGTTCDDLQVQPVSACTVCKLRIQPEDKYVQCLVPKCRMQAHLICLARSFLTHPDQLVPVEGSCPLCGEALLWGELIRKSKGCYQNLSHTVLQPEGSPHLTRIAESEHDS